MKPVVPVGEGALRPVALRVPEGLLLRIDECGKATGNNRTDTMLHLIRWALDQYETERRLELTAERERKKK